MTWTATADNLPNVSKPRPDAVRAVSDDVLVSYWQGRSFVVVSRYVVPDTGRPYWEAPDPEMCDIEFVTHWQSTPPPPRDSDLPPVHVVERDGHHEYILADPEPGDKLIRSYHCLADLYTQRRPLP